jgi:hypothetical protein
MLEVFAYKRYKKHKLGKQTAKEALDKQDEAFIRKSLDERRTAPSLPSVNPLFKLLHRKSSDGRKADGTSTAPTEAELAALKVKDSGRIPDSGEELIVGTTTPTSQEEDLAKVLNSLNMAVSKVQ